MNKTLILLVILVQLILKTISEAETHSEESANIIDVQIKHALNAENEAEFVKKASFRLFDKAVHPNQFQIQLSPTDKDLLICMLVNGNLLETLIVSLDHTGHIIGFSLYPSHKDICDTVSTETVINDKIVTNIIVQSPDNAILPDTFSYIQKLEAEKEAKQKGAGKDNRSFFMKYWMYIVPIFVVMFLSSFNNPEGAERPNGATAAVQR